MSQTDEKRDSHEYNAHEAHESEGEFVDAEDGTAADGLAGDADANDDTVAIANDANADANDANADANDANADANDDANADANDDDDDEIAQIVTAVRAERVSLSSAGTPVTEVHAEASDAGADSQPADRPVLQPVDTQLEPALEPAEHSAPDAPQVIAVDAPADALSEPFPFEEIKPKVVPPPVPSRASDISPPTLPPRRRKPFFWIRRNQSSSSNEYLGDQLRSPGSSSVVSSRSRSNSHAAANYDLLLHRLDVNTEGFENLNVADQEKSRSGIRQLQNTFASVREHDYQNDLGKEINWELWSQVIDNYEEVARQQPRELSQAIALGLPNELRGVIWQRIAQSKNSSMEELYESILATESPHEKAIQRDLSRTSFIQDCSQQSLYHIIKAYSLFDPDVGYTQGMAFVAVPLLIATDNEKEAFSLLVALMKRYGFRELFMQDMPGLHLKLYQFDRIIEDTLPEVHVHLARQGVRSSMYASQWFLTMFAYKFPQPIVMRIFDIVISEGLEAILKFGVALVKRAANTLLTLEFDNLLKYLKEHIFDNYVEPGDQPWYRVNDLVGDAEEVKLLPLTLHKYENEYIELHRIETERIEEVESLRVANGQLTLQVRRLESNLTALDQEHIEVANELVKAKVAQANLMELNENLRSEFENLQKLTQEKGALADAELKSTNTELSDENVALKSENEQLKDQLQALEAELAEVKGKFSTMENDHKSLQAKWADMKKMFGE